jgi:hypothetical protein
MTPKHPGSPSGDPGVWLARDWAQLTGRTGPPRIIVRMDIWRAAAKLEVTRR